ncbi:MAG TPA: [FeFe] hydrogenase H-cluster radical SAM maturase HydE [Alphaproteobacteria bacterium]|nr:[FeFe] hydrogenase H-cluster radical SAM maturase HydE [Alphaproteobacteria bacterium]
MLFMIDKDEIVKLLKTNDEQALFKKADFVRKQYVGDEVYLRGLIEFSNICRNNCLYCGIRKGNSKAIRYHMNEDELIDMAHKAADIGFKTIVLQSGEDMYYNKDRMCRIIEAIKKFDVAITLSIGERTYAEYKAFREAGADRYLMRIETTDKNLYHKLDPEMSWDRRHECLMAIKELGYELGSGIMVGLPEQTIESIADDLLYLKNINVDMAGIGPFIPHQQTPLKNEKGGSLSLALRTMAVMRLLMPDINIPATTAMESLHPKGRIMALQAGANVVMPNVTEGEYRKFYELYPGKICVDEQPLQCKTCIGIKIQSIGRKVGMGYGGHNGKLPIKPQEN